MASSLISTVADCDVGNCLRGNMRADSFLRCIDAIYRVYGGWDGYLSRSKAVRQKAEDARYRCNLRMLQSSIDDYVRYAESDRHHIETWRGLIEQSLERLSWHEMHA